MKYLSDYVQDKLNALFELHGAFYAFSQEQFDKAHIEGVEYVSMGSGLVVRKGEEQAIIDGFSKIEKEGIQEDIADNGIPAIILRELKNHECFYTGDISDVVEALKNYGVIEVDIRSTYLKNVHELAG